MGDAGGATYWQRCKISLKRLLRSGFVVLISFALYLKYNLTMSVFDIDIVYVIALIGVVCVSMVIVFVKSDDRAIPDPEQKIDSSNVFILETEKCKIKFSDPFDNFLIYGGANSGKTKSIGKPLLSNYIRANFAGFIYDYKDYDLTRTVNYLTRLYNYPYKVYNISFTDMGRTKRFNPLKPSVIKDEVLLIQLVDDMLTSYMGDTKRDEWFNGGLGIIKGIAYNLFSLYPQYCTIPHLVNLATSANSEQLEAFLKKTDESRQLASAYLNAPQKAQASYFSSMVNPISSLAFDKKISYVLSGNDFDFDLLNPKDPKLITVSSSIKVDRHVSPIIALLLTISSRAFSLNNTIPFVYFLDEATTFKIPDFEKLPSVLREYKCSFTFLTQSGAKIEKLYSKLDRSSIEANFGNIFYGRTKDVEALKYYPFIFGKNEVKKKSRTTGHSSHSSSTSQTVSTQKEDKYTTNFFTGLKSGEFLLSGAHCNKKEFYGRFRMYNEQEDVRFDESVVIDLDIERAHRKVTNEVLSILS